MPNSRASDDPILHLTLPTDRAAIDRARLAVHRFVADRGIGAGEIYTIELVLEEILMNIVTHGFPQGGADDIDLVLEVGPAEIVLTFEDSGMAFDPLSMPTPPPPTALRDAPIGGRGLMLTRKAASRLDYRRVGARNRLTVGVARQPD